MYKQHYIHGVPVGPSSEGIAEMVLQDAREKTQSLEKITLLPVQDAMVDAQDDRFCNDELRHEVLHAHPPKPERPQSTSTRKYLCEIQRVQRSELTALTVEEMLSPLML